MGVIHSQPADEVFRYPRILSFSHISRVNNHCYLCIGLDNDHFTRLSIKKETFSINTRKERWIWMTTGDLIMISVKPTPRFWQILLVLYAYKTGTGHIWGEILKN